nr:hypothetical protein [Tanacetum cinerariifolium]
MTEARFEDEQTTMTIANPNDLNIALPDQELEESTLHTSDKVEAVQTSKAATYEKHGCQYGLKPVTTTSATGKIITTSHIDNQEGVNHDDNYYWESCFSTLKANKADNVKPPLFADTFGNNGRDDSESSRPVTPTEEVGIGIGDIHGLMDDEGGHNFVQPNAGSGCVCKLWGRVGRTRESEDHRRKPRENGCRTPNQHIFHITLRASGRGKRLFVAAAKVRIARGYRVRITILPPVSPPLALKDLNSFRNSHSESDSESESVLISSSTARVTKKEGEENESGAVTLCSLPLLM